MKKFAKGILISVAVIVVVLVSAIFGIGLYVESQGVQVRLETALGDELRMPVKLGGVHLSPWSGLSVAGIAIASGSTAGTAAAGTDFVHVERISARMRWRSLFSHRVIIRELVISQPSVVWPLAGDGRWQLPRGERAATSQQAVPPGAEKTHGSPIKVSLEAARIEDATVRFLNREGEPMAVLEGVTVRCPAVGDKEVRGSAIVRKITLRDHVTVENISASWSYTGDRLSVEQIDARIAGGSVRGAYGLSPGVGGTPFTLDLLFDGVDLKRLLTEGQNSGNEQNISGTLYGCLDLYGKHGERNAVGGSAHMKLRNGRMDQYPMLQLLGQALQIDELTSLELQRAEIDLRIGGGKALIDSIILESPNVSLTAQGDTGLDGKKLDLASMLTLSERVSRQLPGWVRQHFQPVADTQRQSIRFHVGGSLAHPDADLMRVIVGEKIEKQVLDVYRRFIGGGLRKKKAEKKPENEPGAATPPIATATTPAAVSGTLAPLPSPVAPAPASTTTPTPTPTP